MKVALGSDHAGFQLKEWISDWLMVHGHDVADFGSFTAESVDYPEFAHKVARHVADGLCERGIVICGSGNGVSITANKHPEIRCALAWNAEIAALGRQHNDANVCAIPARFVSHEEALHIVQSFLDTDFEGGRHQRRVDAIPIP